jgi:two-component sensor histidine kinase
VKNNMQVISSMLGLQTYRDDMSFPGIIKDIQSRIKAMAIVHEMLYRSGDLSNIDFGDYVQTLITGLYRAYKVNINMVKLHVDMENISMGITASIPCGLIVNELISNSFKHAFPDNRKGDIYVTMRTNDDKSYTLSVRDNGIGLPEEMVLKNADTMGMYLVKILTEQLDGTLQVTSDRGTGFTITFRG